MHFAAQFPKEESFNVLYKVIHDHIDFVIVIPHRMIRENAKRWETRRIVWLK